MLNPKEEKFAQIEASADRRSQSQSYRDAGYSNKLTDKQVWEEASKLSKRPKVVQRIAELKAETESKQLWTRLDSVTALKRVVDDAGSKGAEITGAVKVLNDMHGYNAPMEIKHTGGIVTRIEIVPLDDDSPD